MCHIKFEKTAKISKNLTYEHKQKILITLIKWKPENTKKKITLHVLLGSSQEEDLLKIITMLRLQL